MDIRQLPTQVLPLNKLVPNTGQIADVPKNPRLIRDERFKQLCKSLKEDDLTGVEPCKVMPFGDKFVVLGGNMRYRALKEIGAKDVSCIVVPEGTPAKVLRKIVQIDNAQFGEYDWDLIANEWDEVELADWGLELPNDWSDTEEGTKEKPEKIAKVEEMLNAAMKQYCGEFRQQLDDALSHGWLFQGLTRGYAKMKFLRAKYYSERYERKNAAIFAPEIFLTSSHNKGVSYYEQLQLSATNDTDAGIAGFRTLTNDGLLLLLLGGTGYPIGGGRSCADFPVEVARDLYYRLAKAGRVLDPCAGWGGRQIGALLAEVKEYVGIDPSPVSNRAANDIFSTFGEYQNTECRFIQKPYEKTTDEEVGTGFDFALTSPPYFDVEDYQGGEQSHKEYDNFDLWCEKFYEPLICITMRRLKPDGIFALQVGSQTYPLRERAEEICKKNGFRCSVEQKKVLNADALHGTDEDKGEVLLMISKR